MKVYNSSKFTAAQFVCRYKHVILKMQKFVYKQFWPSEDIQTNINWNFEPLPLPSPWT